MYKQEIWIAVYCILQLGINTYNLICNRLEYKQNEGYYFIGREIQYVLHLLIILLLPENHQFKFSSRLWLIHFPLNLTMDLVGLQFLNSNGLIFQIILIQIVINLIPLFNPIFQVFWILYFLYYNLGNFGKILFWLLSIGPFIAIIVNQFFKIEFLINTFKKRKESNQQISKIKQFFVINLIQASTSFLALSLLQFNYEQNYYIQSYFYLRIFEYLYSAFYKRICNVFKMKEKYFQLTYLNFLLNIYGLFFLNIEHAFNFDIQCLIFWIIILQLEEGMILYFLFTMYCVFQYLIPLSTQEDQSDKVCLWFMRIILFINFGMALFILIYHGNFEYKMLGLYYFSFRLFQYLFYLIQSFLKDIFKKLFPINVTLQILNQVFAFILLEYEKQFINYFILEIFFIPSILVYFFTFILTFMSKFEIFKNGKVESQIFLLSPSIQLIISLVFLRIIWSYNPQTYDIIYLVLRIMSNGMNIFFDHEFQFVFEIQFKYHIILDIILDGLGFILLFTNTQIFWIIMYQLSFVSYLYFYKVLELIIACYDGGDSKCFGSHTNQDQIDLIQEGECCICKQKLNDNEILQLNCSHKFHFNCIGIWRETNSKCPICNQEIVML